MRRGNNKKVGTYYLMAVQQESLSRARGTRKFFQSARPFHVLHNIVENRRDLLFFLLTLGTNFPLYGLKKERRTSVEILTTTPSWLAFLLRNCLSTLFQRKTSTKITNCTTLEGERDCEKMQ